MMVWAGFAVVSAALIVALLLMEIGEVKRKFRGVSTNVQLKEVIGQVGELRDAVSKIDRLDCKVDELLTDIKRKEQDVVSSTTAKPAPMSAFGFVGSLMESCDILKAELVKLGPANDPPCTSIFDLLNFVQDELLAATTWSESLLALASVHLSEPHDDAEFRLMGDAQALAAARLKLSADAVRAAGRQYIRRKFHFEIIEILPYRTTYDGDLHEHNFGTEIRTTDRAINNRIARVLRPGYINTSTGSVVRKAEVQFCRYAAPESLVASRRSPSRSASSVKPNPLGEPESTGFDIGAQKRLVDQIIELAKSEDPLAIDWFSIGKLAARVYDGDPKRVHRLYEAFRKAGWIDQIELTLPHLNDKVEKNWSCVGGRNGSVKYVDSIGITVSGEKKQAPGVKTEI